VNIAVSASVEINAPTGEVFEWLTDPAKMTAWAGFDQGWLPADSSELKVGYHGKASLPTPYGVGEAEVEVTAYDPPRRLELVETYSGGRSVAGYTLKESGSGTILQMESSTDAAAGATTDAIAIPDEVKDQVHHLPFFVRMFARHQMQKAETMMTSFEGYDSPQFQTAMQSQAAAQLERLKQLIELVERER
jgi:uncharacterized protein YndB with AHSA1/START domain